LNNKSENNYFSLTEALLYFFEKNSLIYLNKILKEYIIKDKKKTNENYTLDDETEPLKIFKECIKYLDNYNNKKENNEQNKDICKLFCIGYIKTFCYKFIDFIYKKENDKIKDEIKIINVINSHKKVAKIITLYIYKIIYNINDKDTYLFEVKDFKETYKLEKYSHFKDFKIIDDDNKFLTQINLDEDYKNVYEIIEKYKFNQFKSVEIKDFNQVDFDKFYFATSNLILLNLTKERFIKSEIFVNFYNNVCKKLKYPPALLNAFNYFYEPGKFTKIKEEFALNGNIIRILIYSYRYCLNEINSGSKDSIYGLFYDKSKVKDINKYFYPGNDIKDHPTYDIYIKIIKHFEEKPKQACFICMCQDGYYYSARDDEPNEKDLNEKCPYCEKPVGSKKDGRRVISVNRENYFRVLTKEEFEYKKKRGFHEYK
jgi:hypothetical protein